MTDPAPFVEFVNFCDEHGLDWRFAYDSAFVAGPDARYHLMLWPKRSGARMESFRAASPYDAAAKGLERLRVLYAVEGRA